MIALLSIAASICSGCFRGMLTEGTLSDDPRTQLVYCGNPNCKEFLLMYKQPVTEVPVERVLNDDNTQRCADYTWAQPTV